MSTVLTTMQPLDTLGAVSGSPPRLLSQLESNIVVPEGEPVHLDIRVASESELQIDWQKDGRMLTTGSRINESYDRGYASLDIMYTIPEDTGMYSCVIRNNVDAISADPVLITVIAEEAEQYNTVAMQEEAYNLLPHDTSFEDRDQYASVLPTFKREILCSQPDVFEGKSVRILGEVAPVSDSSLRVEWFRDGEPIVIGSRFSSYFDRGLVVLDIAYCYPEDNGSYTCVATNKAGSVKSGAVIVTCEADAKIVTTSNLTETSINHLKQLEDPVDEFSGRYDDQVMEPIKPSFKGPLIPPMLTVPETFDAYFEVPVDVGNGNKISVEWRRDGELVHTGSRINGKLELGMASLRFNNTQPTDTGRYVCSVITENGAAESQPADLIIEKTGTIIAESQLTGDRAGRGLIALQELEAYLNAPRQGPIDDDGPAAAPTIIRQPSAVEDIIEGESFNFQIQFEPVTDPNVTAQWFKDAEVLSNGTRFHVVHERGIASLTLLHAIAEDSGTYWCQIRNDSGTIESNHLKVNCTASASIITESNLLEGSEGFNLIKAIEAASSNTETGVRYAEDVQKNCAPNIDVPPQGLEVIVGAPARFLVKMGGFPVPDIIWNLDGTKIRQDSLTKIYKDGCISILELNKCNFTLGTHMIEIIGTNNLGEAKTEANLIIHPTDYRVPDLKHITPENPFRKLAALKKVECTPELNKAFTKAKPTPATLMQMERGVEMKAKSFRSPEDVAVKEMYGEVVQNLRKSEINSQRADEQ